MITFSYLLSSVSQTLRARILFDNNALNPFKSIKLYITAKRFPAGWYHMVYLVVYEDEWIKFKTGRH